MGQFSWLDCKTGEQIVDGRKRNCYLLVPKEFGGGHIQESCYDGYGRFGGKDVYDLVAEWNKDMIPYVLDLNEKGLWKCNITESRKELLKRFYKGQALGFWKTQDGGKVRYELREIGIILACYDEDNARLTYPIKITHNPYAEYEECNPSPSDPNQGWLERNDGWSLKRDPYRGYPGSTPVCIYGYNRELTNLFTEDGKEGWYPKTIKIEMSNGVIVKYDIMCQEPKKKGAKKDED